MCRGFVSIYMWVPTCRNGGLPVQFLLSLVCIVQPVPLKFEWTDFHHFYITQIDQCKSNFRKIRWIQVWVLFNAQNSSRIWSSFMLCSEHLFCKLQTSYIIVGSVICFARVLAYSGIFN